MAGMSVTSQVSLGTSGLGITLTVVVALVWGSTRRMLLEGLAPALPGGAVTMLLLLGLLAVAGLLFGLRTATFIADPQARVIREEVAFLGVIPLRSREIPYAKIRKLRLTTEKGGSVSGGTAESPLGRAAKVAAVGPLAGSGSDDYELYLFMEDRSMILIAESDSREEVAEIATAFSRATGKPLG